MKVCYGRAKDKNIKRCRRKMKFIFFFFGHLFIGFSLYSRPTFIGAKQPKRMLFGGLTAGRKMRRLLSRSRPPAGTRMPAQCQDVTSFSFPLFLMVIGCFIKKQATISKREDQAAGDSFVFTPVNAWSKDRRFLS